jgi:hypothetical protein
MIGRREIIEANGRNLVNFMLESLEGRGFGSVYR